MDIVQTAQEAEGLERPPLLVLDRLESFLDGQGLGSGPIAARRMPSRMTSPSTRPRLAPSDIRMPISRVRWVTA